MTVAGRLNYVQHERRMHIIYALYSLVSLCVYPKVTSPSTVLPSSDGNLNDYSRVYIRKFRF